MRVREFLIVLAAVALVGASSSAFATILIPTNAGGADAELRESDAQADAFGTMVVGNNRGNNDELATRKQDAVTEGAAGSNPTPPPDRLITNYFPTNDRSSVMYMKFNISSLPAANDSFWNDKQVHLKLSARNNNNIQGSDLITVKPGGDSNNPADYVQIKFAIHGLEPGNVYDDDLMSPAARTDRLGNAWAPTHYKYDWTEGTGGTTGITFYNAPGITPHCVVPDAGVCGDANIPNSNPNSVVQTLGKTDDFNSDTRLLEDSWHWQDENHATQALNNLPGSPANLVAGAPITYLDPNGNLKQLLLDAKMAGRTTLTLMVHHNLDGTLNQPNVGIVGTTPTGMLGGQNYLVVPKEFADDAIQNTLDNSTGAFSPMLIIRVPEPASVALLALGLFAALGITQRRRK